MKELVKLAVVLKEDRIKKSGGESQLFQSWKEKERESIDILAILWKIL